MKFDRKALIAALTQDDGGLEDILAKDPRNLTGDEVRRIILHRLALPGGTEKDALFARERAFFDDKFGPERVALDGVGRIVQPAPRRPVNAQPVPAEAGDGGPLKDAVERIARAVAERAAADGTAPAVQALQRGLNLVNPAEGAAEPAAAPLFRDLVDDGLAGPKTRAALRTAVARQGRAKVEEALALGRFDGYARDAVHGRPAGDLDKTARACFAGLFRDPGADGKKGATDAKPTEEGESLQMAVNDLGRNLLGERAFRAVKEDGRIGPKTADAFRRVLAAAGPARMTRAVGRSLGFLADA